MYELTWSSSSRILSKLRSQIPNKWSGVFHYWISEKKQTREHGFVPEKLDRKLWSFWWPRKCPIGNGHVRETRNTRKFEYSRLIMSQMLTSWVDLFGRFQYLNIFLMTMIDISCSKVFEILAVIDLLKNFRYTEFTQFNDYKIYVFNLTLEYAN